MPPAKSLTKNIQAKRTPFIIERDYSDGEEYTCCFCEQRFLPGNTLWRRTWEHLDNKEENEELWNLSWAHWKCNEKKKTDADLQIQAREIIKKNKQWEETFDFESAREGERKIDTYTHTEMDLNIAHFKVTTEYLAEKIPEIGIHYPEEDAIYSIVARCRKLTGHGSHQSVRGYLKELTCSEGKYNCKKIDGVKQIFRRTGQ